MSKVLLFLGQLFCAISVATAASVQSNATQTSAYNYNYMYPYMNNQMRTELNPGTTTSQSLSPINIAVQTENYDTPRRVIARPAARSATNGNGTTARTVPTGATNAARAATNSAATATQSRRVVARSATNGGGAYRPRTTTRTARGDASFLAQASAAASAAETYNTATVQTIPSARCLADYTECMNGYCVRENTAYNRCYCSAKLAQIDSQYQTDINNLIQKIIRLQNTNYWTDAEMNEYWMNIVGKYSGENSWTKLDDALNINWADTESRVRGQNAFVTGHEYCVQHLRGCQYMASNMRDAYRSEISRDCQTYENALQKIKNVAESLVESYQ